MTSIKGIVAVVAVVAIVAAAAVVVMEGSRALESSGPILETLLSQFDTPANPSDRAVRSFVVKQGDTASQISERLQSQGLISDGRVFRWMADAEGVAGDLAAGEYELSPSMKPSEMLGLLAKGKTKSSPLVTIPEGWRSEQVAERMADRGVGTQSQFMSIVRTGSSQSPALSSRPAGSSLEGYLFPDSYQVNSKTTPDDMVDRMVKQFEARLTQEMRAKIEARGLTIHQVVTMASLVEREAVVSSERPLVAGVFYNRLAEDMPLQTDPTVQYALASTQPDSQKRFGWWKTTLTEDDLAIDSPYNTYLHRGLPPGPICNPGLASLQAAVDPAQTDYLYFVAKQDGSHAFAKTLDEHNENVYRYSR
ncbi:MAG TPA: endolytic transglycosylase MltG [Chloroflexota bacterium]|nr:endolytic transglycosylase MltG [Chloroflexota bacterium]